MATPLAASRTRLPDESRVDFTDPVAVKAYVGSLVASLTMALQQRPTVSVSRNSMLFISPNGTSYEMTVDDAGAPVFTKRADPLP